LAVDPEVNIPPEVLICPTDPPSQCSVPDLGIDTAIEPFVFIIYPRRFKKKKEQFKEILENNVKVQIEGDLITLNVKGFDDFHPVGGRNFCYRVCKPIQLSEFCIAICKHESKSISIKGETMKIGKIQFPNENVWWEVGIAMGFFKKVIVFIEKGQKIPSDFYNNISVRNLGTEDEIKNNLMEIFGDPINFRERISWGGEE